MLAGCLLIGFTVIGVAFWLELNDSLGWPNEVERERNAMAQRNSARPDLARPDSARPDTARPDTASRDDNYRLVRRRWRRVVHGTLAVCGALMASAGIAGPGRFWIAAWTAVAILMMTIIVLALGDAFRTHRHYAAKLSNRRNTPSPGELE